MLDAEGFRPNVGMIVCNQAGEVLWARRCGRDAWQFPQGGIQAGESPLEAVYRELHEELGLRQEEVSLLGQTEGWLRYYLPKTYRRQDKDKSKVCIGQKQKWFLFELKANEANIRLDAVGIPEFDDWRWVEYWYPIQHVVAFKRDVYQRALQMLAPLIHLESSSPKA